MYYEKKIYDILNEADEFKAKSKDTGKVVVFKSKDAMDAAVKGGSHEPLDKPAGGSAGKPKGQSVFAKPSGDDGMSSEPKAGGESSKGGKPWKELEGDDTLKHLSKKDLNLTMQFMKGTGMSYGKLNNLTADDKGDIYYSNQKGTGYFKVGQVGNDTTLDDLRADIKKNVPLALKGKLGRPTELGKDDRPVGAGADDGEKSKAGGGDSGDEENYSVRLSMEIDSAVKSGQLPDGTAQDTKLEDIDEDALEDFYGDFTYDIAKEYDITQEIFADDSMYHLDDIAEKGGTIKDMYDSVISSAEEYAADEGTLKFDENKKSKKQPFREHYNRLFKGRSVL